MLVELRDSDLATSAIRGNGIALLITGEKDDKYPELRIVITEEVIPGLRQVWPEGKMLEFLQPLSTAGATARYEALWEHILMMDNELGEQARRRRAAFKSQE